jgi:hypothetical protein
MLHGVLIGVLLIGRERQIVVAHRLLGGTGSNVIGIGRVFP